MSNMTTADAITHLRPLLTLPADQSPLHADAPTSDDTRALQHLLHVLGYDHELQWDRFGADGDYGSATTRAVRTFGARVGMPVDGSRVSPPLLRHIIEQATLLSPITDTPATDQQSDSDTDLGRGSIGPAVLDLQLRLAGFRGSMWDGDYGPGTELQVSAFQRDVMWHDTPSGQADGDTLSALRTFAADHPLDFGKLRCPCQTCEGFGQDRFEGEYRDGEPHVEAYHHREYPGIHRAILHATRAASFYLARAGLGQAAITSGYRCWVRNEQRNRKTTNHMGKAIDIDLPMLQGEDKQDDRDRCDQARSILVDKSGFQTGWSGANRKALEPSNIAPTWVHMDVRCYQPRYLSTEYFVKDEASLDADVDR